MQDYVVTRFVAEFINTFSSFVFSESAWIDLAMIPIESQRLLTAYHQSFLESMACDSYKKSNNRVSALFRTWG